MRAAPPIRGRADFYAEEPLVAENSFIGRAASTQAVPTFDAAKVRCAHWTRRQCTRACAQPLAFTIHPTWSMPQGDGVRA
ncbi:hypothetical protein EON67_05870 [archaeon]|nr:MAG: hypothetical protein EON67_05870 [archaeon]